MKKLVLILTLSTLFASQAFGAALCPTICSNIQKQETEKSSSHCQQKNENEKPAEEMPLDCSIMVLLDTLSTYNVSVTIFDFKTDISNDLLGHDLESNTNIVFNMVVLRPYTNGKTPPLRTRPIYLLTQKFII